MVPESRGELELLHATASARRGIARRGTAAHVLRRKGSKSGRAALAGSFRRQGLRKHPARNGPSENEA
jgi:hypothetical protein